MEKYKSLLTKLDREEIRGRHVRCQTEWLEHGKTLQKFSASTDDDVKPVNTNSVI